MKGESEWGIEAWGTMIWTHFARLTLLAAPWIDSNALWPFRNSAKSSVRIPQVRVCRHQYLFSLAPYTFCNMMDVSFPLADHFSNDRWDFETNRAQNAAKITLKRLLVVSRDSWKRIFWVIFSVKLFNSIITAEGSRWITGLRKTQRSLPAATSREKYKI